MQIKALLITLHCAENFQASSRKLNFVEFNMTEFSGEFQVKVQSNLR